MNTSFEFSSRWASSCFTVNGFSKKGGGRIWFIHFMHSTCIAAAQQEAPSQQPLFQAEELQITHFFMEAML